MYWDLRRKTGGDQFQLVESRVSLAVSGMHEREVSRKSRKRQKMLAEFDKDQGLVILSPCSTYEVSHGLRGCERKQIKSLDG